MAKQEELDADDSGTKQEAEEEKLTEKKEAEEEDKGEKDNSPEDDSAGADGFLPENNAYANANYCIGILAEEHIEVALRGQRRRGPQLYLVGQVPIALTGDSDPILVGRQFYKYWILGATDEQNQALRLLAAVRTSVAARGIDGTYPEWQESTVQRAADVLGAGIKAGEITVMVEQI